MEEKKDFRPRLGDYNTLRIMRFTDHGAYLDGGLLGDILMPRNYVEDEMRVDDEVTVFLYLDQQERLVATTEVPLARVGQFAFLKVNWVNEHGAFLDWGLMKDLFVPFREQKMRMVKDHSYIIYVYVDKDTERLAATAKVDKYITEADPEEYHRGSEVEILVQHKTPLGFKVIVDNRYSGLIYDDQVYEELHTGDRRSATVVNVRPDGKLDVSVEKIGKARFADFAEELEERLGAAGGRLPFTDKSSAEDIREAFGVSKKTFKRAVGCLYKLHKIELGKDEIRLAE